MTSPITSRIAVFPGSFDPFTIGHFDIIERAVPLFDQIIIAIGINSQKKYLYSLEQRLDFINNCFSQVDSVTTATYTGLTINFCQSVNANFLLRGIRTVGDFEYEKTIAQLNKSLAPQIESIFMMCAPQYSHISSTIVREIIKNEGDLKPFLPDGVLKGMEGMQE